MSLWEKFEQDCTIYLNHQFGKYAKFVHLGKSNSKVSDIFVDTENKKHFYIDVKHCPAQCGQFVLLPDYSEQIFIYSKSNINKINKYAEIIINYMNSNFDTYSQSGTAGTMIDFTDCQEVFAKWIIQTCKEKNIRFFITNNFTLFPLEQLQEYFNITATYRIKKSGSGNVGKNSVNEVKQYILENYAVENCHIVKDKLFCTSSQNLHQQRFMLAEKEYMFSLRNEEYELRKLSHTRNANVIFSVTTKDLTGMNNENFIDYLINE